MLFSCVNTPNAQDIVVGSFSAIECEGEREDGTLEMRTVVPINRMAEVPIAT